MLGPCSYDIWSQLLWPCSPRIECEVSNFGQNCRRSMRLYLTDMADKVLCFVSTGIRLN